jgi:glycosyltransferase involved in cell wall biosynthesis
MEHKILIISTQTGIPRVHKIARTLSKEHKVMILEWDRGLKLPRYDALDDIKIHRFKFKSPYGMRLFLKLPIWMIYLSLFFLIHKFDLVLPQNLDTLIPIWIIAKLKKVKIAYDIADFYSNAYVPGRMKTIRKIVAAIERFLIRSVEAVIIADNSRFEEIGNIKRKNISVVYNVPPDNYASLSKNLTDIHSKYNLVPGIFTVFYGGVISQERGLYYIVQAVQEFTNVRLLVAGYGPMEKEFVTFIKGKKNVTYLGRVTNDKILELTCLSNCTIALYDPTLPYYAYASPNKLFESMMCAKPIIVLKGSNLSKIVAQENCGLIIDHYDEEDVRNAISVLKDNPKLASDLGNNARRAYLREYNWPFMESRVLKLIKSIL